MVVPSVEACCCDTARLGDRGWSLVLVSQAKANGWPAQDELNRKCRAEAKADRETGRNQR